MATTLFLPGAGGSADFWLPVGTRIWRPAYRRDFPRAAKWITRPPRDLSRELPKIQAPTLLLWGDADPISPVTVGERLASLLPNARLHVVRGGNHDLAQTHADEAAALVSEHLQ